MFPYEYHILSERSELLFPVTSASKLHPDHGDKNVVFCNQVHSLSVRILEPRHRSPLRVFFWADNH
jgi:hypothetical protein